MSALYYCYACGMRLKPDEVKTAEARGESHATACCEGCAKAGKRVKDPRTVDVAVASAAQEPAASALANLDSASAPARIPARISGRVDRGTPARPVTGPIRRPTTEIARAGRNTPASGSRIDNIRARTATPAVSPTMDNPVSKRASIARIETESYSRTGRKSATSSDRKSGERAQTNAGMPLAAILGGAGAVIFLIGVFIATRSNNAPREADARVNTIQQNNETESGPKPEEKKPPVALSGADERRLADFERNMPSTLGPAPRSTIFFGPMGLASQAQWREGSETQRRAEGKLIYLDGTRKAVFQTNAAGSVTKEPIVIEYSAMFDIDAIVWMDVADCGMKSGSVRFPAGSMQKIEIVPDDEKVFSRGKPGKASGKNIVGFGVEPRGVQPGVFGIFRISR